MICHANHRLRNNSQVKTGDSINCTNLSTCTNICTVISKSALTQRKGVDSGEKDVATYKMYSKFDACS